MSEFGQSGEKEVAREWTRGSRFSPVPGLNPLRKLPGNLKDINPKDRASHGSLFYFTTSDGRRANVFSLRFVGAKAVLCNDRFHEDHLVLLGLGSGCLGSQVTCEDNLCLEVLKQCCSQVMVAEIGDTLTLPFLACLSRSATAILVTSYHFALLCTYCLPSFLTRVVMEFLGYLKAPIGACLTAFSFV
ncbi:hypothetical protein PoB_003047500 [Plakobranchus ocellatus]|uniref:Uncharacterized protein n=1 Tax=Plakobranchus ocellatus TaxID=259542 RepID=A0AAV4A740_9GAST|nr:hypothetical protein PoB_003047500 [Plakobranchus ocellatus]